MKKIIVVIILFLSFIAIAHAQKTGYSGVSQTTVLVLDRSLSLDSSKATQTDSVTLYSDKFSLAGDSVYVCYELTSADSLLVGTAKDSIMSYMKLNYVSPGGVPQWSSWTALDSISYHPYSTAARLIYSTELRKKLGFGGKGVGQIWCVLGNNYPSTRQALHVKIWVLEFYKSW